jgi:hypothetical protein
MRSGSSALHHAMVLLVLWMVHCGNELVAAAPPGQSPSSRQKRVCFFPLSCNLLVLWLPLSDVSTLGCHAAGWYDYSAYTDVSLTE